MTKKQWNIILYILLAGSVLAAIKIIFFDYTMDEEYQMMMGYRTLRGDHLFKEMWEPHQTSAFLCTGLMWIYKTITGTYTGVLLYLRVCTTLIQIGISLYLYKILIRLLEKNYALLCSLIYFNVVPKIIQIPDFSNMQVWFFTLMILSLMHYYLLRDQDYVDKPCLVFLSGICMALEVLSYPSCIILFPFCLLYLFKTSQNRKWRDILLFSGACAVSAAVWLCIILQNIRLEEFIRNVEFLLSFDPTHEVSGIVEGKLYGILKNSAGGIGFLALAALISIPVMIIIRKKHKELQKQQLIPVFLTVLVFVSECTQLYLWVVRKSGYEVYQLHLFTILASCLVSCKYAGNSKKYFTAGIIGTLLSYIAVIYISDLDMFYAIPHGIPGVLFCAIILVLALKETFGKTADKWIYFLLISLCCISIFGKGYTMRTGRDYNVVLDTKNIMKHGPAAGILSDYMNCHIYNCNYEDFGTYVSDDDVVLIVTNMVTSAGTTPYMITGAEVAHFSIVDPTSYDERLLTYWELYPEKQPDVIVVDCWYGQLQEDPESWIIQYIENEFGYTQVDDGSYVRFYRK